MSQKEKTSVKRDIQPYVDMLSINTAYLGISYLLMWLESKLFSNGWFSVVAIVFFLSIPIYTIGFGIKSFKRTGSVLYPNLLFWISWLIFWIFMDFDLTRPGTIAGIYDMLLETLVPSTGIALVSFITSVITSIFTKLNVRKKGEKP